MKPGLFDTIRSIVGLVGGEQAARNLDNIASGVKNVQNMVATPNVTDGTLTVNGHSYSVKKSGRSVYVTFTNIPSDFDEFSQVYHGLLGKNEYSAVAMIPMAIEMYARNEEEGNRCLELLCTFACKSEMSRRLKEKFGHPGDSYCQRYLPAALLQGANNKNAYTPTSPYTVCVENGGTADEESEMYNGTFYNRVILGDGWDMNKRAVQLFRQYDKDVYQISGCAATYMSCKPIRGSWPGLV